MSQELSCFHHGWSNCTEDLSWKHENNSVSCSSTLSLSFSNYSLCLIKSHCPRVDFRTNRTVQKLCLAEQKIRQRSRRLKNGETSYTNYPWNVYILSLNKTYIKYCYGYRQCPWLSVWNITKRVSSREIFSFKLCEFNVQIIA